MKADHRKAASEDVEALLLAGLAGDNVREIHLVSGLRPEDAIRQSFQVADICVASYVGDDIVALWGVRRKSRISPEAYVWLVASKNIEQHRFLFAKESRRILDEICKDFTRVENFVDCGNESIIRWLRWLGFRFDPDPVQSPLGHWLLRFWR